MFVSFFHLHICLLYYYIGIPHLHIRTFDKRIICTFVIHTSATLSEKRNECYIFCFGFPFAKREVERALREGEPTRATNKLLTTTKQQQI